MSLTLNTTQMVARLQRKFPIGLGATDCMDFLNEAFRKIDQFSKAGFIWQVTTAVLSLPAGVSAAVSLPSTTGIAFDPGKSAWLRGFPTSSALATTIPFKSYQEFYNQQHFSAGQIGLFSCWTYVPDWTAAPVTYAYKMLLAPEEAYPLPAPLQMQFTYHKVTNAPLTVGANIYFPTPDQFDSLIIDLAEAELGRIYKRSGWDADRAAALQGVAEIIDNYRTDKFDLAGLSDLVIQAQERQADKAK